MNVSRKRAFVLGKDGWLDNFFVNYRDSVNDLSDWLGRIEDSGENVLEICGYALDLVLLQRDLALDAVESESPSIRANFQMFLDEMDSIVLDSAANINKLLGVDVAAFLRPEVN